MLSRKRACLSLLLLTLRTPCTPGSTTLGILNLWARSGARVRMRVVHMAVSDVIEAKRAAF